MRFLTLVFALITTASSAQLPNTAHTWKRDESAKPVPATIQSMAWLAGAWEGEGLGGISEEVWMAPQGGSMLGTYRLVKEGKPVFYEILTIVEENGGLVMRLKHFNADLKGWEEKDKSVEFVYLGEKDGVHHFSGLAFQPKGKELTIWLALRGKDGAVREETFQMRRRGGS
jgi:hypothetical protein